MADTLRKPEWLKINLSNNSDFATTGKEVKKNSLHTICQSGRCPNLNECWNRKTATFMIGGDICTRACKFCNTKTGRPAALDSNEPLKIAESILSLDIKHAVITSVDRDDLPDYGAKHWAETISMVKKFNPDITMEVLIPDFKGDKNCLDMIIEARPEIISHNLETVNRLSPGIRSVAKYDTSLEVLKYISSKGIDTKSGIMLGLGEQEDEIVETMHDLLENGCQLLSIGQYLQPSKKNIPVERYIPPKEFKQLKEKALSLGFRHVESGPFVRSSYMSSAFLRRNVK